jgi:hypothetical protein
MTTKKSTKKPRAKSTPDAAKELEAFAHHLSEALRIGRTSEAITSGLYNDLADAWNEFLNDSRILTEFQESEEYINLALLRAEQQ